MTARVRLTRFSIFSQLFAGGTLKSKGSFRSIRVMRSPYLFSNEVPTRWHRTHLFKDRPDDGQKHISPDKSGNYFRFLSAKLHDFPHKEKVQDLFLLTQKDESPTLIQKGESAKANDSARRITQHTGSERRAHQYKLGEASPLHRFGKANLPKSYLFNRLTQMSYETCSNGRPPPEEAGAS